MEERNRPSSNVMLSSFEGGGQKRCQRHYLCEKRKEKQGQIGAPELYRHLVRTECGVGAEKTE